jgi:hypothetical protein
MISSASINTLPIPGAARNSMKSINIVHDSVAVISRLSRLALRPSPSNGHAKESRDRNVGVEIPRE